jgi:hypothetical protein
MPADLLEQQAEVDRAFQELDRNAAQENAPKRRDQRSPGTTRKTMWRKVFEGHEEFLGLTPD